MTMAETTSRTWTKLAQIKCDTVLITKDGIRSALISEFGLEGFCSEDYNKQMEEVQEMLDEGYITICDDGIIVWMS